MRSTTEAGEYLGAATPMARALATVLTLPVVCATVLYVYIGAALSSLPSATSDVAVLELGSSNELPPGITAEDLRTIPVALEAWTAAAIGIGMLALLALTMTSRIRREGGVYLLLAVYGTIAVFQAAFIGRALSGLRSTRDLIDSGAYLAVHRSDGPGERHQSTARAWAAELPTAPTDAAVILCVIGAPAVLLACVVLGRGAGRAAGRGAASKGLLGGRAAIRLLALTAAGSLMLPALAVLLRFDEFTGWAVPDVLIWGLVTVAALLAAFALLFAGEAARTIAERPGQWLLVFGAVAVPFGVLVHMVTRSLGGLTPADRIATALPIGQLHALAVFVILLAFVTWIVGAVSSSTFDCYEQFRKVDRILLLKSDREQLQRALSILESMRPHVSRVQGRLYLRYIVTLLNVRILQFEYTGDATYLNEAFDLVHDDHGLYESVIGSGQRGWNDMRASSKWRHLTMVHIAYTLVLAFRAVGSTTHLADAIKILFYLWNATGTTHWEERDDVERMIANCLGLMHEADPGWDLAKALADQEQPWARRVTGRLRSFREAWAEQSHPWTSRIGDPSVSLLDIARMIAPSPRRALWGEQNEAVLGLLAPAGLLDYLAASESGRSELFERCVAKYEKARTTDDAYLGALTELGVEQGDPALVDHAISAGLARLREPRGRWQHPDLLIAIGMAHWAKYRLSGEPDDLESARRHMMAVSDEPAHPVQKRLEAAVVWAEVLRDPGDVPLPLSPEERFREALDCYTATAALLPSCNLLLAAGETLSTEIRDLLLFPRSAAMIAVAANEVELAVEFFELDRLMLQERFVIPHAGGDSGGLSSEDLRRQRRGIEGIDARGDLLHGTEGLFNAMQFRGRERMRRVKDLDALLAPSQRPVLGGYAELAEAASEGSVVLFNITNVDSSALVLLPGGTVRAVRLGPEATTESVESQADLLEERLEGSSALLAANAVELANQWLWSHIVGPVVEVLDEVDPRRRGAARIWLCPTGPLARLPLASARHPRGLRLLDMAVPAVTTSLRTLVELRRRPIPGRGELTGSFVGLAPRPGRPDVGVPGVESELEVVKEAFTSVATRLDNAATTRELGSLLQTRHWLHLACHCTTMSAERNAGIALADRAMGAEDILSLGRIETRFAVLPICGAARTPRDSDDESLHPAGALYRAGVPNVLGTLWQVYDHEDPAESKVYPMVSAFYRELSRQPAEREPDFPLAYRNAVASLMVERPRDLHHWCAFVCMAA